MRNAIYNFPIPNNEPVKAYLKGSPEREALEAELKRQTETVLDIPIIIGGKEIRTGNTGKVVMPHNHQHVLATYHKAGPAEVKMAIDAAMAAHAEWELLEWTTRVAILMRVAELITGKYRALINAASMLGQSKNCYQAEIDAVCELADFIRYNAAYASKIYNLQPKSAPNQINSVEYRPLEGFVFALSPFNFTSIASNLALSPVLMGNTVVWKPSTTSILSNYYLMQIYKEAGLPDGVVNFIPGSGAVIGKEIFASPDLAGVHFTGSSATFKTIWRQVGENLDTYKAYPRLVGETGGKDFIFVHPSAVAEEVGNAAFCGAYEFQGQKCSAASRMYVPESLWPAVLEKIKDSASKVKMGDVADFDNFINAVIDEASFDNIASYIDYAKNSPEAEIVMGGKYDKSVGYFVEPTVIVTTNPHFKSMEEEIFGPVLTVYVYPDAQVEETAAICDKTSPYALTGAIWGRDRVALERLATILRYTAGNFYINDKPTGAVVGMQPFGGSRASGTNDKAGGELNLIRWVLPRSIKETLVPPTDHRYTYMK